MVGAMALPGLPCLAIYDHGTRTRTTMSWVGATPLQPKDRVSHPGGNSFHNLAKTILICPFLSKPSFNLNMFKSSFLSNTAYGIIIKSNLISQTMLKPMQ
ncbi:hypothetical protein Dimus_038271 [Dionaea muscipula]